MASLQERNKTFIVQFSDKNCKRQTVYLGKMPKRNAETIRLRIEELNTNGEGAVSPSCVEWLKSIGERLSRKLAKVGLISHRRAVNLKTFLENYIAGRTDVNPTTVVNYENVQRHLLAFFGPKKQLEQITTGDTEEFRRWLQSHENLSPNTIRRRCGIAKQFFHFAQRKKLVSVNPFADMKGFSVTANRSRDYHLSREDAAKVLAACPDAEWRLMFALARYGGLRVPSELLPLKWSDINWDLGRIKITSPKTERHGHESRIIPIFPELRPYLDELFFLPSRENSDFVIQKYRDPSVNLRTQLTKIVERAGLKPWPKLWQNLRATRATELASQYPAHVAADWLGHSTMIAQKHYWRTQDSDFEKALLPATESDEKSAAQNNASSALSKSTLQESARKCNAAQNAALVDLGNDKTPDFTGNNEDFGALPVVLGGLEPPIVTL